MRRHWQRRPLLIRGAIERDALPGPSPKELFALAARDDVESRMVRGAGGAGRSCTLEHGPFSRLPSRRTRDWTLLVQGANLRHEGCAALLERFRFVPDARLDDVMVSFAGDGGGVGPHLDSYDVFLLQLHGRRRWRIGKPTDLSLVEGAPLKILRRFEPTAEWVLEPGDMLYLPPRIAHDGVALGECMTASVGFRAPSNSELLAGFHGHLADAADVPGIYSDRGLAATSHPARLPQRMVDALETLLERRRATRADMVEFLGCSLSEPKPQVWFTSPSPALQVREFARRARGRGLRVDARTIMLYSGRRLFVNGEPVVAPPTAALRHLADRRRLSPSECAAAILDSGALALLHEWHAAGWLHFAA